MKIETILSDRKGRVETVQRPHETDLITEYLGELSLLSLSYPSGITYILDIQTHFRFLLTRYVPSPVLQSRTYF